MHTLLHYYTNTHINIDLMYLSTAHPKGNNLRGGADAEQERGDEGRPGELEDLRSQGHTPRDLEPVELP